MTYDKIMTWVTGKVWDTAALWNACIWGFWGKLCHAVQTIRRICVVWTCLDLRISVAKEAYTLFNLLDDDRDGEVSYDAGLRSWISGVWGVYTDDIKWSWMILGELDEELKQLWESEFMSFHEFSRPSFRFVSLFQEEFLHSALRLKGNARAIDSIMIMHEQQLGTFHKDAQRADKWNLVNYFADLQFVLIFCVFFF